MMMTIRRWAVLVLTLVFVRPVAADEPGLAIGAAAPAFRLLDQNGNAHTLNSLLADQQAVAVIFHRSADW